MSREVVFLRWCSSCESDGNDRVEATESYTIGLVKGETRPAPRVLDVCDAHAEELRALAVMIAKHSIPLDPKAKPSPIPPSAAIAVVTGSKVETCRVCGEEKTRSSLARHVWTQHRSQDPPPQPLICPVCRERFEHGAAMAMHRSRGHGWSSLDDAYEGLSLKS